MLLNAEQRMRRENPLLTLLQLFDQADIAWVSWKNNHEIDKALSGKTNFDIFVPRRFRPQLLSIACQNGWLRMENPVACFPGVLHLFAVSADLRVLHLHVYFSVVTGESWLKEYALPLEDYLLANRRRSPDAPIWMLNAEAQAYVFSIRHLLKGASLLSRMLYSREIASYAAEWAQCGGRLDGGRLVGPINLRAYEVGSGLDKKELELPRLLTALRFRISLSPLLRVRWYSLPMRRLSSLAMRVLNRLVCRRTRIFHSGGLIVAVCGVDGTGKTTLLRELEAFYSALVTVRRVQLGRPQGALLDRLWRCMRRLRTRGRAAEGAAKGPGNAVIDAVVASFLGLLRLRRARRAERLARSGYLVLADRWPTGGVGRMDGPRLNPSGRVGWVGRACARLEAWVYSRMPRADICVVLQLPLSVSVVRNRLRTKPNKESDLEIRKRFHDNVGVSPFARQNLTFDNNGELAVKRVELIHLLWTQLVRH